jgi:hypothetical protein
MQGRLCCFDDVVGAGIVHRASNELGECDAKKTLEAALYAQVRTDTPST